MCETSSKIQCPDCALYWEAGIKNCTCGKCMQPSERNRQLNKERYDVLSIPGYVIKKKNPTHGDIHGPSMRQCMYYRAHEMLKKARKHKGGAYKTFWTDVTMMTHTASLCRTLGGLRNRSFNTMESHWKTIPTWPHNKKEVGTRNHGNFL